MTSFDVNLIRDIASGFGYDEIDHNQKSRMISFRKGGTRINVYYSTRTVGTCLNHPSKGKTQLFRRDVNIDMLHDIFAYPRKHTGIGYYRKRISHLWEPEADGKRSKVDSAMRWRFVASASGLTNDENVINKLAVICGIWDSLYWDEGNPPDILQTKFKCGSICALLDLVLRLSSDLIGDDVHGCSYKDVEAYQRGDMSFNEADIRIPNPNCALRPYFLAEHGHTVNISEIAIKGLPYNVQLELLMWLYSRTNCGYVLTDQNLNELRTEYSDAVNQAHKDYAEMAYPKKSNMCPFHGVLFN